MFNFHRLIQTFVRIVVLAAVLPSVHAASTWTATGSLSESELTELFTLTEFNSENFSFNSVNSDLK